VRGYQGEDLIEGATLAGSAAMLDVARQAAVTVSF
jgi:predicted peroxiredoxin